MTVTLKLLCYVAALSLLVAGGWFLDDHRDWLRRQIQARIEASGDGHATPAPEGKSTGRHGLTESPPVTVADLDRLVSVGFTTDQVVSEIERRGVLRGPEAAERTHIESLAGGHRLLEAMESPKNLLDDTATANFGRRQAGALNVQQVRAALQSAVVRTAVLQSQTQGNSAQQQQFADYRRRLLALNTQLAALRQKRAAVQKKGEIGASITLEIERLERERDALVSPL